MRSSLPKLNKSQKLDALFIAAGSLIIIYAGVFHPSWVIYAGLGVALAAGLYALGLRQGPKKIGMLLAVTGLALIAALPANWLWSYWERRGAAAQFELEMEMARPLIQNLENIDRNFVFAYWAQLAPEQPFGRLEIPRIGIVATIVEGSGKASLMKGVGHVERAPIPGMKANFPVAGDRVLYGAPFLNLDDLEQGDEITVTTPYGKFTYIVFNKMIVSPDDVSVLKSNGTEMITLITCDPPWDTARRLIVQGIAIDA